MTDHPGRLSLEETLAAAGLPLHGDFYTRAIRSIQALLGQDPQQLGDISFRLDKRIAFQVGVLDATRAPYRKNEKQFDIGIGIAAVGAQFGEYQLFNIIPTAQAGQAPVVIPFRIVVVDSIDWQGAQTGTLGVSPGEDTQAGLVVQPLPCLLEDAPTDYTARRNLDSRLRVRVGSTATPTAIGQIVRGLPNVGAAGIFQKVYGGLCVFPGESLLCVAGVINTASYFGATGRLVELGIQAPQA